ncbi:MULTISPECIES: hypothetical protein [Sporosarcina]|uniref:Uncharacterized protein n=1 Tax=Sporosarcina contaminans TaxID=633403 RepID=A0ABW3TSJ7_9BACL
MKYKLLLLITICTILVLIFPQVPGTSKLTQVFRLTNEPNDVITQGTSGTALTINISFGDKEATELIKSLEAPYPLLLIDVDWAERFPETVELIKKKNIPTGLLGHAGMEYEQDIPLLIEQIKKYETIFDSKPLWFRSMDEQFPYNLRAALWESQVNALGSTRIWEGGESPPVIEGEILSLPHHRNKRISIQDLKKLQENRDIKTLEDVLFSMTIKTKKIPK